MRAHDLWRGLFKSYARNPAVFPSFFSPSFSPRANDKLILPLAASVARPKRFLSLDEPSFQDLSRATEPLARKNYNSDETSSQEQSVAKRAGGAPSFRTFLTPSCLRDLPRRKSFMASFAWRISRVFFFFFSKTQPSLCQLLQLRFSLIVPNFSSRIRKIIEADAKA